MEKKPVKKHKYDNEHRDYVRDTVCAVVVLAVLFLAPIGITLYQNHKAAVENEAYMQQLQELLAATPSDASESGAAEGSVAGGTADESAAGETAAESEISEAAVNEINADESSASE